MQNMNPPKLTQITHHRIGVHGRGFYAVAFIWRDGNKPRRMIATVYNIADMTLGEVHPSTGHLAVLDADEAAQGRLGSGQSRGDDFEPYLRQWIAQWEVAESERIDALMARRVRAAP